MDSRIINNINQNDLKYDNTADAALYNQARCETDEDCDRNEVCMSWQYDPALEYAR